MKQKENWNKDKLQMVGSDEYNYMGYIEMIENKLDNVDKVFNDEIDLDTYYDIINSREKIKDVNKLMRIHSLLCDIEAILISGNEE